MAQRIDDLYPAYRWFLFDGLVKHDLETGREERYAFGAGVFGSETPPVSA